MEDKAVRGLNVFMRMLPAFAVFAVVLTFLSTPSLAQATGDGEIKSVSVTPENPVVLKQMTVAAEVWNPTVDQRSYRMTMQLVQDGKIRSSQEFAFSLDPGLGNTISTSFVPRSIGDFEMVVKLTDEIGIGTDDIEISEFAVTSDIGPFDVAIESPSRIVRPGDRTPLVLALANMGLKGMDVEVRVGMDCRQQEDIAQSFYIFVPGESSQEKIVSTDTCSEVGQRSITASIVLYNRTWITALNQVFLNETVSVMEFDSPDRIVAEPGKSTIFNLEVMNIGEAPLTNMRLYLPSVPSSWMSVNPETADVIGPGERALFVVNVTPDASAPQTSIVIGLVVSTDQMMERGESEFRILALDGDVPVSERQPITAAVSTAGFQKWIVNNELYIIVVGASAAGAFVLLRIRSGRSQRRVWPADSVEMNSDRLERIRRSLRR